MNNYKYIGTVTWNLIHTLLEKISMIDFDFETHKHDLLNILKNICLYLPYNSCKTYYFSFFNKININNIKHIIHLKNIFFLYHNFINSKVKNNLLTYEKLSIYSSYQESSLPPKTSLSKTQNSPLNQ